MEVVGITGGTGFIGRHLTSLLTANGYNVVVFTRKPSQQTAKQNVSYALWNAESGKIDQQQLAKIDTLVHLAGENLAGKRWTDKRKEEIADSRVKSTAFIVNELKNYATRCKTFICASATGFYGPDRPGLPPFTEDNPSYTDFLAQTCQQWEAEAQKVGPGIRTIVLRFGVVLGKESGAFAELAKPMSFGIKPILGSGKQVVSWIEIDDLARMIKYAIGNSAMYGIYNAVAPHPVTHLQLMDTIAKAKGGMHIPVPVPSALLHILLGEMSTEVLKSCTASAQKLLDTGFTFIHGEIDTAIDYILGRHAIPG